MAQLIGVFRIGRDAELRRTDQSAVTNLALAGSYGRRDSDGSRPTQWVDASLWGKRAESLAQYLLKGQQVYAVINDAHIETYDKRDSSEKGFKLVGVVADIELVGSKPNGSSDRPRREERDERRPARDERRQSGGGFDDVQDDIPF